MVLPLTESSSHWSIKAALLLFDLDSIELRSEESERTSHNQPIENIYIQF